MTRGVVALWWLTCLIWSSVWLFIKIGVTDVPPITFAGLRLAIALLLLTPVVWRHRRLFRLPRRDYGFIALTGVILLAINYALVFWGAQFITSGTTAMLQASTPAVGILLAGVRRGARIDTTQLFGAALGVAGVAVVSASQSRVAGPMALIGSLAVAGGAVCVAIAYTTVKSRLQHLPPVVILPGQLLAGCLPLLVGGVLAEGNPLTFAWTSRSVVALLYLATVGSIAGFWLNLWLLRKTTASAVLGMSIVQPLLALVLGSLVLHERLHALTAVGAALILLSVWLVVFRTPTARGER